MESVQNWCSVDTRTGRLTCVLEENYCFNAELYADQLPNPEGIEFREDQRSRQPLFHHTKNPWYYEVKSEVNHNLTAFG